MSNIANELQPERVNHKSAGEVFACLHDLLVHHARTAPRRKAILSPGRSPITYSALLTQVNTAVRELRSFGIGRRDRVAVLLPPGADAAVAILAAAVGAVCVPLNPDFTADECQRYFGHLEIEALLTRADMVSGSRLAARALGIPILDLALSSERPGAFNLAGSSLRAPNDEAVALGTDDAFILLTSGTTSRPKMVPLTHASVCLSAYNAGAALTLGPRDRLLHVLPLFHAHGLISGLLTALAAGSSVVATPGFDAAAFFGWLTEFRPTWYTAVPAIHRALLSAAAQHKSRAERSSLRLIRSASSSLPSDLLGALEALFGIPVIETYGMTEAASQIAANPLGRRKPGSVGRQAGAQIAIMDDEGQPLSTGERGEIHLRGPTITRGYCNDAAANAAAFRRDWFRTGDLGYLDRDGYLFIVGRSKDVINRGGQKIAPAEVEEALLSYPGVVEAVAFSVPHRRLAEDVAAAVVLRPGANVSTTRLRSSLRKRLASYKVPGLIRIVPQIPRGPGGKIKRDGLAAALAMAPPTVQIRSGDKVGLPRSNLERQLAAIWAELLEIDQIGITQDVFALGADSLTATQMLSRLRVAFGVVLSFIDVFEAPTVASLAARIEATTKHSPVKEPKLRERETVASRFGLSLQQQRFYVLTRLDPTGYDNQIIEVARLSGPLDSRILEASLATLCDRHEVLRSTFVEHLGEPTQTVGSARRRLERLNLGPCPEKTRAATIEARVRALLREPFDLERGPLLRAQLLRLDEQDHALLIKLHHLITDGWSQRLFWKEVTALYMARLHGRPATLPKLPIQYRYFVAWQQSWLATPAAEQQRDYWRRQLEDASELPLRTDRPRPDMRSGRGARHPVRLSRALSRSIKSLSRAHRVTPFMTLLAAFQCLLFRYTRHEDVAVGSLIANRTQIETEPLIGMFANTLVLRTDLSGDPRFSEVLRRVRQVTLDAYRNQELPIEEILRVLKVSRSRDRNPLFQAMFILQNASPAPPALPGLSVNFLEIDPGIARADLILELIDSDARLAGWLEYSSDLFEATTMARMAAHLRTLLKAIVADPEERISRLPLLPANERRRILTDWNATATGPAHLGTFYERFAGHAQRAPDAIAVSAPGIRLSYRQLLRRALAIASQLGHERIRPDVPVILLAERGVDFLAAMIAVQKAGAAFLPLDPTLPAARLAEIVQHSRAALVLVGEKCTGVLEAALSGLPAPARPQVLSLEEAAQGEPRDLGRHVRYDPASLAYIIYTSGSTGVPKGAMVEQQGMVNHLLSLVTDLKLSPLDVVAHTSPQSFVISVWQFFVALLAGGRVHVCADAAMRDPALLAEEIGREGVTVLQIVPAMLRAMLARALNEPCFRALSRLRWLNCTGEALPPDLCHDWFRAFPNVPLVNAYGSTECSDDVARHYMTAPPMSLGPVPIGRPIANTRLYVLDGHLQPVPIGVVGELYVGGIGVGRGYLNNWEQTRQRFLHDPFCNQREARLYRTGDLARWRADRTLEFLGRIDHQVKIRGYRVELAEIEQFLLQHADVKAAIVLARNDLGGEAKLIAHIVATAGRQPDVNGLREFLKARLPGYMVPAGFIFLERLPLTPHGKLDRPALLANKGDLSVARGKIAAPRTSIEKILAEIWADLLGIEGIGVSDNFFDLGGHSLLASQVLARISNIFGASLPIRALFEAATVEALAKRVEEARATPLTDAAFEKVPPEGGGPHPASITQEQVLRIERELPGLPQFNLPLTYRLRGRLNVPALKRSLAAVVRRHEALRTRFAWVGEEAVAHVTPVGEAISPLMVEDLAAGIGSGATALRLKKAKLIAEQDAWTPFDAARAPLFRMRLLCLGGDEHILIVILHHIIVDGWSVGVFMREVSERYAALVAGRQAQLPEPVPQFSDFARWQRRWSTSAAASRQLAYWRENLRGLQPIFPTASVRATSLLLSRVARQPIQVTNRLIARLGALSRSQDATLFITLLTAFKAVLLARNGCQDICVATTMANRSETRTERVIGPLANTILIRSRIDMGLSFRQALNRVRHSVLDAYSQQALPFEILSAQLVEEDGLDPASYAQILFVLQNAFPQGLDLPEVEVQPFVSDVAEGQPVLPIDRTWLTVALKQTPSGISGSCNYKSDLFEPNTIAAWVMDYTTVLARACANPETSLHRLTNR